MPKIDDDTICGQHIGLIRQVEQAAAKIGEHSAILVRVEAKIDTLLSRAPDRREDHDRSDDPPRGSIPWSSLAKIGTTIGVTIGTAIAAWQAGPAIMKAVAP